MPPRPRSMLGAALACALTACVADNAGVPPPLRTLHYPVALAVSPNSRFLYVINSDFNLEYNGGTVNVVDLDRVRTRIAACPAGVCPPETGRNAEEDVIPESGEGRTTVRINPFATDVALRPGPGNTARMYITVRGDGTLTWIDTSNDRPTLSCGELGEGELCAARNRVGGDPAQSPRMLTMPTLPVAVSADPDGYIVVAHQESPAGRMSLFYDSPAAPAGGPVLVHWVGDLARSLAALYRVNPGRAPGSREEPFWYAFSRDLPVVSHVHAFPDDATSYLYQARSLAMTNLVSDSGVRAVTGDPRPGAHRIFAVVRPPGSTGSGRSAEELLSVDIADTNNPTVTDVIELPPGPSRIVAMRDPDPAGAGHTLVYAVSFDARKLFVIDADEWRVIDQVRTQPGPHNLVADPSLLPGATGAVHPYLYLVDFLASCVEVIDVGPGATHNRVVFTIGDVVRPRETL